MKISLVTCGRCGKPRGLVHTCVARFGRRRGRTRIRVRATCGRCGKRIGNPLRHACTTRTDFRKRRAAAARAAATAKRRAKRKAAAAVRRERARARRKAPRAAPKPRHDYQACAEPDCQRQACAAWREGVEEGLAACPREHA
jgi:hypothetical protein